MAPFHLLALETSCDETAGAILSWSPTEGARLLASEIASQAELHRPTGGVVPEAASRQHLRDLAPLVERTVAQAGVDLAKMDAFAATLGPGLAGALMIGAAAAKGLALGRGRPFLGVNHLEGHLLSPFFDPAITEIGPAIGLVVSGGHTLLVEIRGFGDYRRLGGTLDDAAGEAFDKVAKLLGLGYPGGPVVDRLAASGDAEAVKFTQPMRGRDNLEFSFSGLKTSVRYALQKLFDHRFGAFPLAAGILEKEAPRELRDFCASSLYANGLDVKAIQEVLGHSWLSTTTRYIHVPVEHVTQAWNASNARTAARLGPLKG